jgi:hypothetical protein
LRNNLGFRVWYYFRIGWGNYFTFVFAAINTLTVTYYLAIEQIPTLKQVFPSFFYYVIMITALGVPFLIAIGYFHFKKSNAYKAERDISVESDPYVKRILQNTENILPLYLRMSDMLVKISNNEKLSDKELTELKELQNNLLKHIDTSKDYASILGKKTNNSDN